MLLQKVTSALSNVQQLLNTELDVLDKKSRKPYTITKPRESWTKEEHQRFVDALKLYERDWKKIGAHVKSKTVIQIRSHAQKYFIKMQKVGRIECIPPPRPKRKSRKPYPKSLPMDKIKRYKQDQSGYEHGYPYPHPSHLDPSMYPYPQMAGLAGMQGLRYDGQNAIGGLTPGVYSSGMQWHLVKRTELDSLDPEKLNNTKKYIEEAVLRHTRGMWFGKEGENKDDAEKEEEDKTEEEKGKSAEFTKVYDFLVSLFSSSHDNHINDLEKMSFIEREIVQHLMYNLERNLLAQVKTGNPFLPPEVLDEDTETKELGDEVSVSSAAAAAVNAAVTAAAASANPVAAATAAAAAKATAQATATAAVVAAAAKAAAAARAAAGAEQAAQQQAAAAAAAAAASVEEASAPEEATAGVAAV